MSMTVSEIIEECSRRSIEVLCIGDFEVRLFPGNAAIRRYPDWLAGAAGERALGIIPWCASPVREQYVIPIFGDKREERRRKRYEDRYG